MKDLLLKLNKIRHFTYTKDSNEFDHKINKLIGRGNYGDGFLADDGFGAVPVGLLPIAVCAE